MEDKLLINRCKRGDTDSLRKIYEKYRNDLLILAIAFLNDINSAEDAVHDVFVSFVENIEKFSLTKSLKGYLSTCVANRCRNLLRLRKKDTVNLDSVEEQKGHSPEAGRAIECNEQLLYLSKGLAQLPEEQREVIVLHIHCGMRFGRIAGILGISVNTVKSRYRYGIDKLRVILNSEV